MVGHPTTYKESLLFSCLIQKICMVGAFHLNWNFSISVFISSLFICHQCLKLFKEKAGLSRYLEARSLFNSHCWHMRTLQGDSFAFGWITQWLFLVYWLKWPAPICGEQMKHLLLSSLHNSPTKCIKLHLLFHIKTSTHNCSSLLFSESACGVFILVNWMFLSRPSDSTPHLIDKELVIASVAITDAPLHAPKKKVYTDHYDMTLKCILFLLETT